MAGAGGRTNEELLVIAGKVFTLHFLAVSTCIHNFRHKCVISSIAIVVRDTVYYINNGWPLETLVTTVIRKPD